MSAYEELVERVMAVSWNTKSDAIRILAEVLRTLETVTPEMAAAWAMSDGLPETSWLAMLRASPLAPPITTS